MARLWRVRPLRRLRVAVGRGVDEARADARRVWQKVQVWAARRGLSRASRWFMRRGCLYWIVVGADILLLATIVFLTLFTWGKDPPPYLSAWPVRVAKSVLPYVQPFLLFAAGISIFWSVRRISVVRRYRRRAINHPKELVRTAGSILDEVVGRDQLCRRIMDDLHTDDRRVHVLQGGIGSGKTAALVQLTRELARKGAIPINVRLRDAQKDLNFNDMALERFKEEVNATTYSASDAERIYRLLRRLNKIVVLADGLDEALTDDAAVENDRDGVIRSAIRRAQAEGLPLVVTSRPHEPLRCMDAVVVELEPLGEGPAIDFVQKGADPKHFGRLADMVLAADVADTPLYLTIARRLYHEAHVLWRDLAGPDLEPGQTAPNRDDRPTLQRKILVSWLEAMRKGYMYQDYALKTEVREETFETLSALACVSLLTRSREVRFEALVGPEHEPRHNDATAGRQRPRRADPDTGGAGDAPPPDHDRDGVCSPNDNPRSLRDYQWELIKNVGCPDDGGQRKRWPIDETFTDRHRDFCLKKLRYAAVMGEELGIVDAGQDSVRFRHSLIQAFLGSRHLHSVNTDHEFHAAALRQHSKEFLIALIMATRDPEHRLKELNGGPIAECLGKTAEWLAACTPAEALQVYAAAFATVMIDDCPDRATESRRKLTVDVASKWKDFRDEDIFDRALSDARLDLVRRMGEAARGVTANKERRTSNQWRIKDVYHALYSMATTEHDYPTRLAITQEIGLGGDVAFMQLSHTLEKRWDDDHSRCDRPPDTHRADGTKRRKDIQVARDEQWLERNVCAWLAPLLYFSTIGEDSTRRAEEILKGWVDDLATADPNRPEQQPDIETEIALAQGFKHVANRRIDLSEYDNQRVEQLRHKRALLIELTESALAHSHFWFSQLTLIHALALLSLPEDPTQDVPGRGHGSDPYADMRYWVNLAGSRVRGPCHGSDHRPNPLVLAAAKLACLAISSRRPEQFIWIDEDGVAGQVGSSSGPETPPVHRPLWILASAGWATLHPRAQALVADVLLMLNLAGRGNGTAERMERLRRADRNDLPPCLTRARDQLAVSETVGSATVGKPGANCIDDCPYRLCPYPPVGQQSYHAEISEGLCRKLAADPVWFVPWQKHLSHKELKRFWTAMAERGRPRHGSPDEQ